MAAPTQTGVEWKIGFGNAEYIGYQVEDLTVSKDSDEEVIKDTDGATQTIINYDAREIISITLLVKSTGSIDPPAKNSLVSLKGPSDAVAVNRRVQSSSAPFTRGVTRLTLTLIREDSMAATYDA